MNDKCVSVSVWVVGSWVLWITAAVALLDGVLVQDGFELAYLGLGISAAAATMSMRCFCVRLGCELKSAFEMGRDIGRAETEAEVRSLR